MDITRREFVERGALVAGALAIGSPMVAAPAVKKPRKGTDRVQIGKTGIKPSLIGLGTGTHGWAKQSNQTRLGKDEFTRTYRHAYDVGIRFFDCADQYGSHEYIREALKGLPRDSYVLETKSNNRDPQGMRDDLDRFRKELGVDYIDIVYMHCVIPGDWNKQWRGVQDVLEEAKQKKIIKAQGCTCHSIEALDAAALDPWVDVNLSRFNPWGKMMDNRPNEPDENAPKHVRQVLAKMHDAGKGVLGMKVCGEGTMVRGADRLARIRESLKFSLATGIIEAFVIGVESPQQVDELLGETQTALAELASQKTPA